jgi:hypothetical protein
MSLWISRQQSSVQISMQSWRRWKYIEVELQVEVNLRPTVSRPVHLGVRHPSGTGGQFFFLLEISFRQLRVCYLVALSPTRKRVCNLLYNFVCALPEQSVWGPSLTELTATFYCLIWDTPNLEGQVPVFKSPRNRVAQLYPRAPGSLYVASYESQGCGGGILTSLHTGRRRPTLFYIKTPWSESASELCRPITYINSVRTSQESQYTCTL